jgi:hypothetical protein
MPHPRPFLTSFQASRGIPGRREVKFQVKPHYSFPKTQKKRKRKRKRKTSLQKVHIR